jgi:hypothetical protein
VAIFVALDTAVASASVTALFDLGRAIVAETHGRMSWKAENDPMACKNMAKYRGPVLYVVIEIIWPTAEITHAVTMWKQCSPERPECHEFNTENRKARK